MIGFGVVFEQKEFEALPTVLALIEAAQLQGAVGEVKRIVGGLDGFVHVDAPGEVLEAGEVAAIGIGRGIEFFAHLELGIDAGIEEPFVPAAFEIDEILAVDHRG